MIKTIAAVIAMSGLISPAGAAFGQNPTGAALVEFAFGQLEDEFGLAAARREVGRLSSGGSTIRTFDVPANAPYIIIGACDEGCSDLDLVVSDTAGREVGSDHEDDDAPMVAIPAGPGGRYTFEVEMASCNSNCHWGVRAYAVTP